MTYGSSSLSSEASAEKKGSKTTVLNKRFLEELKKGRNIGSSSKDTTSTKSSIGLKKRNPRKAFSPSTMKKGTNIGTSSVAAISKQSSSGKRKWQGRHSDLLPCRKVLA
eukprot:13477006-Ditylum_brightwellii.AAC.1